MYGIEIKCANSCKVYYYFGIIYSGVSPTFYGPVNYKIILGERMNKTHSVKAGEINQEWLIIDATDLVVGRLATEVAAILRGKNKPTFTPHMICGDNVIIINADKVRFTGNKLEDKKYYRHTNHVGGLKTTTAKKIMETHPERIMEKAIKGMLPKTKLGRDMYRNLYIYAGTEHPHAAQQPKEYKLRG